MIIAVLFVLLFSIAAWAAIYARGPWQLKLAVILFVPIVGLMVTHSLNSYKGYPAKISFPNDSQFVSCLVEEPAGKFKGRIYLWLIPINLKAGALDYKPAQGEPRSYSEPYDRQLHEACASASKAQQHAGGRTVGFRKGKRGGPRGLNRPHAYILPAQHLPAKETR